MALLSKVRAFVFRINLVPIVACAGCHLNCVSSYQSDYTHMSSWHGIAVAAHCVRYCLVSYDCPHLRRQWYTRKLAVTGACKEMGAVDSVACEC